MRRIFIIPLLFFLPALGSGQALDVNILKAKACIDQNKVDSALTLLALAGNSTLKAQLMGKCYYKKRLYAKASQYYVVADSLNQGSSSLGMSRCFAAMNKLEKASFWLRKYLALPGKKSELEIIKDTAFRNFSNTKEWNALWHSDWYSV